MSEQHSEPPKAPTPTSGSTGIIGNKLDNSKITDVNIHREGNDDGDVGIISTEMKDSEISKITITKIGALSPDQEKHLKDIGVDNVQIEELKTLIKQHGADKPSLTGKIMKWMGTASATLAGKSLADKVPQLVDFITNLVT